MPHRTINDHTSFIPFHFLDSLQQASLVIDRQLQILFANTAFINMLQSSAEAVIGSSFIDFLNTTNQTEHLLSSLKNHNPIKIELIHQDILIALRCFTSEYDTEKKLQLLSFQPLHDDDEKAHYALADQSPIAMMFIDLNGNIQHANPAHEALTGYSLSEVSGKNIQQFRSEHTSPDTFQELWDTLRQGHAWQGVFRNKRKYGDLYWETTSFTLLKNAEGIATQYIVIKQDSSDEHQLRTQLQHVNHLFSTLFNKIPISVLYFDHNGNIIETFGDVYKMLQVTSNIFGYTFHDLFPHLQEQWQRSKQGQILQFKDHAQKLNKHLDYMLFSAVDSMVLIIQDITEQVRSNLEYEQHEALSQALIDSATIINGSLDLEIVTQRILDNILGVVPFDAAHMILLEEDEAMLVAAQNYPGQTKTEPFHISLENPILKRMIAAKSAIILSVDSDINGWDELPGASWAKSFIGVPIQIDNHVFGFINLDSQQQSFYTPRHAHVLQAFAQQAAIAVRNSRVHQHLQNYANEIATLDQLNAALVTTIHPTIEVNNIAKEIVKSISNAMGSIDCHLLLLNRSTGQITSISDRANDPTSEANISLQSDHVVSMVMREGKSLYIPNIEESPQYQREDSDSKSELIIPLLTSVGVIGALHLQAKDANAFSRQKQRALQAFSSRAATAIENTQLYSEISRFAAEQEQKVIRRTQELNRSREQIEAILNGSGDAIIFTKPDGRIRQTNPAFDTLFGYKEDELFGELIVRLVDYEHIETLTSSLAYVVENQTVQRSDIVAYRKDGTDFAASITLSTVLEFDEVRGIVITIRDISQQKHIEESLRTALRKEREVGDMKSRFVSIASHEFRTPLASILSSSDLLQNYRSRMDEDDIDVHLNNIQNQVRHMEQLLEDVLAIGKAESGRTEVNLENIELHDFCFDIVQDIQNNYGHEYPIHFASTCQNISISADKKLMRQIITNLLSNAIKYSQSGSHVEFEILCERRRIKLRIQDFGIGIPEEDQKHIFTAFHRATNVGTINGTGLGLSIVKFAVEAHGGQIEFESTVGHGTTFTISLPNLEHRENNR